MSNNRALPIAALVLLICWAECALGSAIPMWEFLTRDEKMSHLYRIFSQEVTQYCADSPMPDCNKNLLVTGLKNLANIDDYRLDEMDPYQRGAKDIIWRALLGNGREMASRLGQHSFHATDADPLAVGDNELPQETSVNQDYLHPSEHSGPYLTGPMVIRVYPDGRPVPSDAQRPLPEDEDIEDIRLDTRIPSIGELETPWKAPEPCQPPRQMLPPKETDRPTGGHMRYYVPDPRLRPRVGRPGGNDLLVRERIY